MVPFLCRSAWFSNQGWSAKNGIRIPSGSRRVLVGLSGRAGIWKSPKGPGKFKELPRTGKRSGRLRTDGVRRLFENSTVCLIVNANHLTLTLQGRITTWWCGQDRWGLFLDRINKNQFGFDLASIIVRTHASGCGCFSFTESLILAQDERWWRA